MPDTPSRPEEEKRLVMMSAEQAAWLRVATEEIIAERDQTRDRATRDALAAHANRLAVLADSFDNGITEKEMQTVMEWAQARDLDITPPDYRVQHSAIQAKLRSAFKETGSNE